MAKISSATIRRLSRYYRSLAYAEERGVSTMSSEDLAQRIHLTAAQVRKDLSFFGAFGRRGLGYNVSDLKNNIARILGIDRTWNVAVIGAGNIGRALINFAQFKEQGFLMKLVLDNDSSKVGQKIGPLSVKHTDDLKKEVRNNKIDIAILCVPVEAAQKMVDALTAPEVGVKAILNFAPISLSVPGGVYVTNENMAIEIEALSFALTNPEFMR